MAPPLPASDKDTSNLLKQYQENGTISSEEYIEIITDVFIAGSGPVAYVA